MAPLAIIEEKDTVHGVRQLWQRSGSVDLCSEEPINVPATPNLSRPSIKSLVALQKLADETTRHHRLRRMSLCPEEDFSKTQEAVGEALTLSRPYRSRRTA